MTKTLRQRLNDSFRGVGNKIYQGLGDTLNKDVSARDIYNGIKTIGAVALGVYTFGHTNPVYAEETTVPEKPGYELHGSFSAEVMTRRMNPVGVTKGTGEGALRNNLTAIVKTPTGIKLIGFATTAHDLGSRKSLEEIGSDDSKRTDFSYGGLKVAFPLTRGFSADVGASVFDNPAAGADGKQDWYLEANAGWTSSNNFPTTVNFYGLHQMNHPDGTMVQGSVNQSIPVVELPDGKGKFGFNANVAGNWFDDFSGSSGFSHVTAQLAAELGLNYGRGVNGKFIVYGSQQIPMRELFPGFETGTLAETQTVGGVKVCVGF